VKIYDFKVKNGDGSELNLNRMKNKVVLIINTATKCRFTPQYIYLNKLYQKFHDLGFEILDFPCNQFGKQAPGSNEEIKKFCLVNYNTKFSQLAKIDVNGDNASPLFTYLKDNSPAEELSFINKLKMQLLIKPISKTWINDNDIKWNFTKFLIDRKGNIVKRYNPTYDLSQIEKDIITLIKMS